MISLQGPAPLRVFARQAVAATAFLLLAFVPAARAQTLHAASAPGASVEDRRKALNGVFHDYWEDVLQHEPEFASAIGDKRRAGGPAGTAQACGSGSRERPAPTPFV